MLQALNRRLVLAVAIAFSVAGPAAAEDRLPVVASFSILGDLVANVGGSRIELTTLVGANGDGHTFQPSPADARKVAAAKAVFINGLGFEGWIPKLVKASGATAPIIVTSTGIEPLAGAAEADHDPPADGHDHGAIDPHAWQSLANAKIIVANIRDGLIKVDPAGETVYRANTDAYLKKLDALEIDVKAAIAGIPEARRRIITSHDAFGYFGKAYGVAFIAPQGVSTEAEPNAKAVARIIRQIRKENIPAVFIENISDPRLIKRIADETKAVIGGTLYSDALSASDGPAGTYIDMMRHNIRELAAALSS